MKIEISDEILKDYRFNVMPVKTLGYYLKLRLFNISNLTTYGLSNGKEYLEELVYLVRVGLIIPPHSNWVNDGEATGFTFAEVDGISSVKKKKVESKRVKETASCDFLKKSWDKFDSDVDISMSDIDYAESYYLEKYKEEIPYEHKRFAIAREVLPDKVEELKLDKVLKKVPEFNVIDEQETTEGVTKEAVSRELFRRGMTKWLGKQGLTSEESWDYWLKCLAYLEDYQTEQLNIRCKSSIFSEVV